MNNRCKLTIDGKDYKFLFDNNSLLEFCDLVKIDIGQFGQYAQDHQGTLSRDIFFTAALIADQTEPNSKERFTMGRLEFGNLMIMFKDSDYIDLTKAFESSRPELKKKTRKNRRQIRL